MLQVLSLLSLGLLKLECLRLWKVMLKLMRVLMLNLRVLIQMKVMRLSLMLWKVELKLLQRLRLSLQKRLRRWKVVLQDLDELSWLRLLKVLDMCQKCRCLKMVKLLMLNLRTCSWLSLVLLCLNLALLADWLHLSPYLCQQKTILLKCNKNDYD